MENKLTIKRYSEVLGISVSAIQQRINRGTLTSFVDGVIWVIPSTDTTKSVGRPRKK